MSVENSIAEKNCEKILHHHRDEFTVENYEEASELNEPPKTSCKIKNFKRNMFCERLDSWAQDQLSKWLKVLVEKL